MPEPVEGRFADRTVLVTGSNYAIGEATVKRFAREGASVVVTGAASSTSRRITHSRRGPGAFPTT